MPKFTKQQLEEQYNKLPPVLKDALFSAEIANKMFEVGKRNSLTIEEIGLVAEETGHIILGLTRPEDFGREIETRLNTDEEEAQKITREVNKEVFFPLREALKAAHQMEITETESRSMNQESRAASPQTLPSPPKVETTPHTPTPAPAPIQRPMTQPVPPKPATSPLEPESRTMKQESWKEKITPSSPKPIEPSKPPAPQGEARPAGRPEPVKPPAPKIPPIDLRKVAPSPLKASAGKTERMREAIFAPPVEPQEATTAKEAPPAAKQPAMEPKQTEKKAPYGGYDPYKESVE